jgi:hypothetical protein
MWSRLVGRTLECCTLKGVYTVFPRYIATRHRHPRIPPLQDAEPISTHVKKPAITLPSLIAIRQAILGTKCSFTVTIPSVYRQYTMPPN